jgi:hypothetical protein
MIKKDVRNAVRRDARAAKHKCKDGGLVVVGIKAGAGERDRRGILRHIDARQAVP